MTHEETNWAAEIGAPYAADILKMVEALKAPFTRENTEEPEAREAWASETCEEEAAWSGTPEQWEAALEALNEDKRSRGYCDREEAARERIQEDALSIEVRGGWTALGSEMVAEEFAITIATGGPAARIRGELDAHGYPARAWLEVQDWGKPWTEFHGPDGLEDACLKFAAVFCWEAC